MFYFRYVFGAYMRFAGRALSDISPPIQAAKMVKYMGGTLSCDIMFGLFMVAWFVTRHVLLMVVVVSVCVGIPRHLSFIWDPPNGHYVTNNTYIGFLGLMGFLQVSSMPSCMFETL